MLWQYWRAYKNRPGAKGDICDVMSAVGCFWMMPAERFWKYGGMDTGHGGWGNYGVEIACKSWLSGGRQVVNKRTWGAHMFRSQWRWNNLWPISQEQIDYARDYSRDLWMNNKWPGQIRPLSWLISKFSPVPGWEGPEGVEVLAKVTEAGTLFSASCCATRQECGIPLGAEAPSISTLNGVEDASAHFGTSPCAPERLALNANSLSVWPSDHRGAVTTPTVFPSGPKHVCGMGN